MPEQPVQPHLDPTQEAGREFFSRNIQGPVVMLNLMRFREIADYSGAPHLAPYGVGGKYLIGPSEERWDAAMLVRQASLASFLAFASDESYLPGTGHRTAALEDSRLLPLVQQS
jgi:hypothetical protein